MLCLLSGAVFFTAIHLSDYLGALFQDVNLGADMVILPKGITPESMHKSLQNGQPEALMPLALFETLQKQAIDQTERKNLNSLPIKLLVFLPLHDDNGSAAIAKIGDINMIKEKQNTSWSQFNFKNLEDVQTKLVPKEVYSTDEWKDKTIFGILVNGENSTLIHLKQMIDRRTIAQAYIIQPGHTDAHQKLEKLKSGLFYLTSVIIFSVLLGVIISF